MRESVDACVHSITITTYLGDTTLEGALFAATEGGITGSLALICVAGACEFAGGVVLGGTVINGIAGVVQGVWTYADSAECHSFTGYLQSGASGALQGGIPWDVVLKALRGGGDG